MTYKDIDNMSKYLKKIEKRNIREYQEIGEARRLVNDFLAFCKKEKIITGYNDNTIRKIFEECEE